MQLFPGMRELLADLSQNGHRLAIATGKSRRGLERALDATGLRPHFRASRCADETHPKPHPAMLLELLDELSRAPEQCADDRRHLARPRDGARRGRRRARRRLRRASRSTGCAPAGRCGCFGERRGSCAQWLSDERLICASAALADSGRGVRFEVEYFGETRAGVRRPLRRPRCTATSTAARTSAMELDWQEGVFFDCGRARFAMLDARRHVRRGQRPLHRRPVQRQAAGQAARRGTRRQGLLHGVRG